MLVRYVLFEFVWVFRLKAKKEMLCRVFDFCLDVVAAKPSTPSTNYRYHESTSNIRIILNFLA